MQQEPKAPAEETEAPQPVVEEPTDGDSADVEPMGERQTDHA